jgi:hypothetical protein
MINKLFRETFETTTETLTDSDRDTLDDIKNRLSTALTVLMSAAKSHATKLTSSTPTTPSQVHSLENAASTLTAIIIELVRFLNFRQRGGADGKSLSVGMGLNVTETRSQSDQKSVPAPIYQIDELKVVIFFKLYTLTV